MLELARGLRVHIVGVGGAGLSAIAQILLERGCVVSGSDMHSSARTAALAAQGACIYRGHDARYVRGADVLLATSAVPDDHVELLAARALGIPVQRRRAFMPAVLRGYNTIAVAGTHGKTTTTSMLIHILRVAGCDPSFIVGGDLGNGGRNAAVGAGKDFVIEADEYANMFLGLEPRVAILTTVEHDHPDFFPTPESHRAAFERFIAQLGWGDTLLACADDAGARQLAQARRAVGGAVIAYGIAAPAVDWRASDLRFSAAGTRFKVWHGGRCLGEVRISSPGRHNVLNALAALAAGSMRGVSFGQAVAALRSFRPTARRFQIRGERDGVIVVDDYAHHPTEIRLNLRAARQAYPRHSLWALWQPHTYSRVRQFWQGFAAAFSDADEALITPIYAAREAALPGISSAALAGALQTRQPARYCPTFDEALAILRRHMQPPALLLIFSAGDANRIAELYLQAD